MVSPICFITLDIFERVCAECDNKTIKLSFSWNLKAGPEWKQIQKLSNNCIKYMMHALIFWAIFNYCSAWLKLNTKIGSHIILLLFLTNQIHCNISYSRCNPTNFRSISKQHRSLVVGSVVADRRELPCRPPWDLNWMLILKMFYNGRPPPLSPTLNLACKP